VPLGVILLTYFGRVLAMPGLLAVLFGIALTWETGLASWGMPSLSLTCNQLGFIPSLWLGELWSSRSVLVEYFSIILPMGLFNLVGSLQRKCLSCG